MRKLIAGTLCLGLLSFPAAGTNIISSAELLGPDQTHAQWIGYQVETEQLFGDFWAQIIKPIGVGIGNLGNDPLPVLVPDGEPAVLALDTTQDTSGRIYFTSIFLQFRTETPPTADLENFKVVIELGSLDADDQFVAGDTSAMFLPNGLDNRLGTPEGEIPTSELDKYSDDFKTWSHHRIEPSGDETLLFRPFDLVNIPPDGFAIQTSIISIPEPTHGLLVTAAVTLVGMRRRRR